VRIVFHIEVHKTGTTFLQAFLARNCRELLDNGIFYKPIGESQTTQYEIIRKFSNDSLDINLGQQNLSNLKDEAIDKGCHTLLVSSEMLCEQRVDIEPILSVFSKHEVLAIAYVRRSDEIVLSAYNQLVRDENQRRTHPLSERNDAYDPSYRLILSRWIRPEVRLILAPYDSPQWIGGTIASDFLSMLGIDDSSSFDFSIREEDSNVSFPSSLIDVLRLANRIRMSSEDHRAFVLGLYELYKERPGAFLSYEILTPDLRREYCRQFAEAIHIYRPHFRTGFDETFLINIGN